MKHALVFAILLCSMTGEAMAGRLVLSGNRGPTSVDSSCNCTGVVNTGTITGGTSTGLTVTGTPAHSVTNTGTITGSTGLLVSGSGTITNTGTIKGTSTSGTTATAVGVSQLP